MRRSSLHGNFRSNEVLSDEMTLSDISRRTTLGNLQLTKTLGSAEDRIAIGWIDMPDELRAIHAQWRESGDEAMIFAQPGPNGDSLRVVLIRVPRDAAKALGVNDLLGDMQAIVHQRTREIQPSD